MSTTYPVPRIVLAVALATALLAGLLPAGVASAAPPSLAATPSTDLVDGQTVNVAVTAIPDGTEYAFLMQCPVGTASGDRCIYVAELPPSTSSGDFSLDVGVLALYPTYAGPDVDCRVAPGCELRAVFGTSTTETSIAAPLGFDPLGSLRPPATASAVPTTGLDLADPVAVSGSDFDWWRQDVWLYQCRTDAIDELGCWVSGSPVAVGDDGSLSGNYRVGTLVWAGDPPGVPFPDPSELETFDCRTTAGSCALVVRSQTIDPIVIPLTFRADATEGTPPDVIIPTEPPFEPPTAPAPQFPLDQAGRRYLDLVFEDIEVIEDVVYWPDAPPLSESADVPTQDLLLDIYLPAGDTLDQRPVIIAFETSRGSWVVQDYVRRGYVVVAPEVRGRPSTPGLEALLRTRQGLYDGAAAVRWLRANAETYGLHPEAYAATGYSGAGILSMALAWGQENSPDVIEIDLWGVLTVPIPGGIDWGDWHADQPSDIAAAFPRAAWYPQELIDPGEPPMLMLHGIHDTTYDYDSVERICPAAHEVGVTCILRPFDAAHGLGEFDPEMSEESAAFLYQHMLEPLGLLDTPTEPADSAPPAPTPTATPVSTNPSFTG